MWCGKVDGWIAGTKRSEQKKTKKRNKERKEGRKEERGEQAYTPVFEIDWGAMIEMQRSVIQDGFPVPDTVL